jgi:hypothetical protein
MQELYEQLGNEQETVASGEAILAQLAEAMNLKVAELKAQATALIDNPEELKAKAVEFASYYLDLKARFASLAGMVGEAGREIVFQLSAVLENMGNLVDLLPKLNKKTMVAFLSLMIVASLLLSACGSVAQAMGITPPVETAAAQTQMAQTQTAKTEKAPSATPTKRAPSKTPAPSETPSPTATEVSYDFSDIFTKKEYDKQWPLQDVNPGEAGKLFHCEFDADSIRKTNFTYADLTILRVADCYFIDASGETQLVTVPLAAYKKDTDQFYAVSEFGLTKGKGMPGDAYIDSSLLSYLKQVKTQGKYTFANVTFNDVKRLSPEKVAFFKQALAKQVLGDSFVNMGDPDKLLDFDNAENFAFPSVLDFVVLLN